MARRIGAAEFRSNRTTFPAKPQVSTDSHTGLATAEEENFFGKHSQVEPEPHRWEHSVYEFGENRVVGWEQVSSGYAAVWATENTREAIFDAMERREVYATTGPRMTVWFFGGWEFNDWI